MNSPQNQKHSRRPLGRTIAASALALALAGAALPAAADHGKQRNHHQYGHHSAHHHDSWGRQHTTVAPYRDVVRVRIPVRHYHAGTGPETLKLKKLIRQQTRLDLSDYRLKAVVVKNGPFSNGYATLRTGDRRSGRSHPGREES